MSMKSNIWTYNKPFYFNLKCFTAYHRPINYSWMESDAHWTYLLTYLHQHKYNYSNWFKYHNSRVVARSNLKALMVCKQRNWGTFYNVSCLLYLLYLIFIIASTNIYGVGRRLRQPRSLSRLLFFWRYL